MDKTQSKIILFNHIYTIDNIYNSMYLTLKPAASLREAQCGSASEAERDLDFV